MWTTRALLESFEKLSRSGLQTELEPGTRVARGFADLGYEEFYLLPNEKLVSILTGAVTQLKADERSFFFPILAPDQMVEVMLRRGFVVDTIQLIDGRKWRCRGRGETAGERETIDRSLDKALLDLLLSVVAGEGAK